MKKERKKSFPIRGVCYATVTENQINYGIHSISSQALFLAFNYDYCDLTLRTGYVYFESISKIFLSKILYQGHTTYKSQHTLFLDLYIKAKNGDRKY